jgi:hypothetical protein
MKSLIALISLVVVFTLILSCQDNETLDIDVNKRSKTDNTVQNSGGKNLKAGRFSTFEYTFDGTEGDPISFEIAQSWIGNYRDEHPAETEAHFFGRDILTQLLAEEGSVGIRVYYGLDENGNKQLILVGVDTNGGNLLPSATGGDNIIVDMSYPCPTFCPPAETSF